MTILLTLVNLLVIAFLAHKEWRRSPDSDTAVFWSALSLRLAAGLTIGLLYQFYYHNTGDTFVFFNEATRLASLFYEHPAAYFNFLLTGEGPVTITGEPRTAFFVSILSVVNLATANNYWLSSLWFSLFSFWCSYRLVLKLDLVLPRSKVASRVALLFVPSVVLWSSGIVKESLAFGAIAILALHFLSIARKQRPTWLSLLSIVVYSYLLLSLKYYWGAVLIPSMVSALVIHWTIERKTTNPWLLAGSWLLVFCVLSILVSFTHPNFYMDRFLTVIVGNHNEFIRISRPDNLIEYYNLSPEWSSIIVNSPWALWSGLFRPMVFEASSVTGFVAALENLLLIILVVWKLKSLRMPLAENRVIAFTAMMYVIVLCVFLALSTPNLGTLSRYRVGFLSFFVLMILVDHPVLRFKSSSIKS